MNSDTPIKKLDDIAFQLGQLAGYVHEHRHGVNNLSMKMDGLSVDVAKQIAALEAKMTIRIEQTATALNDRLTVLEAERFRRDGATSVIATVVKSPVIGWIALAAAGLWAFITGKVHP